MPKKSDATGLPPEMPRAPGNAKAGQSPSRRELGEALPAYLDPANAKWTKSKVEAAFPSPRPSKIGAPGIDDLPNAMNSHIPAPPAQGLPSPVKDPTRSF
jgi:hypothetical protein